MTSTKNIDRSALTTSQKASIIKKAIKEARPDVLKISVTKGSGTASGWITTRVTLVDDVSVEHNEFGVPETNSENRQHIEEIAREALQEAGTDFYTFSSDDGYGSEMTCHSIEISYEQ
jgi:hypothetical protein